MFCPDLLLLSLSCHALCNATQEHRRSIHCESSTTRQYASKSNQSSHNILIVRIRARTCNQHRSGYHNNLPTPSAAMAQPLPFGMREKEGWWAKPRPFITLPFVVGSVCGHTLSGATVPPRSNSIPAADTTHCSKCVPMKGTCTTQSPIAVIPTVVGTVCHHALGGINTPIGSTTIPAAATRLCATCTSYSKLANETSASYKQWQDSVRAYSWTSGPQEEDPTADPVFMEYLSGRALLARHYERLRLKYEQETCRLQDCVDPALPIVNLDGVALLPALENELDIPPQAVQATLRRVKFDEEQQHPSRETARGHLQYKRIQRGQAYRPGRYAEPTGSGWENTSSPTLY